MMFFNFNRIFGGFASQLDTLLEKPDLTLEQILDEDILQELKVSGQNKFGGFVTKNPDTFERVLHYILQQDEELINKQQQIRYPFMLSEVFQSENPVMIDYLFEPDRNQPDYEEYEDRRVSFLPKFFTFLEQDYLNLTAAGYFAKVVLAIIRRRGYDLWDFLTHQKQVLSNLIKHLDVFHAAEIIEKLIILDTQQEDSGNYYMDERRDLIKRVINVMTYKSHQQDVVENSSQILIEVCQKSDKFLTTLSQPQKFFTIALNSGVAQTITLIITLVEQIQKALKHDDETREPDNYDFSAFYQICQELPRAFAAEKIQLSSFTTTYGAIVTPFSLIKLKLVQLYFTLLKINDPKIIDIFTNLDFYSKLQTYLIRYEFNNQLQNLFYDITVHIFNNDVCLPLQEMLIQHGLYDFIAHTNVQEKRKVGRLNTCIKSGFYGILNKLSNSIISKAPKSEIWEAYVTEVLQKVNSIESVYMLGINPNQKPTYDDDPLEDNNMRQILARIEHHRNQNQQINQDDNQETVEIEEHEENDDEYNENQEETQHEEGQQIKGKLTLDEEVMEEKIQEVILSPKTSPKDVQQIIQFQEKALNQSTSPQDMDKTDSTVNKYWKAHDQHEQQEQQEERIRKHSQEEIRQVKEALVAELVVKAQEQEVEEEINFQESTEDVQELVQQQEQQPVVVDVKELPIDEAISAVKQVAEVQEIQNLEQQKGKEQEEEQEQEQEVEKQEAPLNKENDEKA